MKNIILALLVIAAYSSVTLFAQENPHKDEKIEVVPKTSFDGKTYYGEDFPHDITVVKIADLYASPDNYKGKVIAVEGDIAGVCQNTGCWVLISDGEKEVRALTVHKYFHPKDLGKVKVMSYGEFGYKEIDEETAKHYAEEQGKNTDDIKGPQMMYFIKATGTKVLN